jgi:hypothetical protein
MLIFVGKPEKRRCASNYEFLERVGENGIESVDLPRLLQDSVVVSRFAHRDVGTGYRLRLHQQLILGVPRKNVAGNPSYELPVEITGALSMFYQIVLLVQVQP